MFAKQNIKGENRMKYRSIAMLIFLVSVSLVNAAEKGKHLFILSGQSNMKRMDPDLSFSPTVVEEFGEDNVIVVKFAEGGKPIRRWYKKWKPAEGGEPQATGDLYDRLMAMVNKAIQGNEVETVTFVWMQGERDAKDKHDQVYAESLNGLIHQLEEDLGRGDINFVIGRLSDCVMTSSHWVAIREAQVKIAEGSKRGAWVDTDDLNDGLNKKGKKVKNDLHYTVEGYKILGERFAGKSIELIQKNAQQRDVPDRK
ncbi:MAG: sialate O-acetylesterase [Rubritalea sp.]|uniref:sialate O-acetylesterase n=1 Tax=Rubritalea sp. TaxID=2109375 RepID=UPI003242A0FE